MKSFEKFLVSHWLVVFVTVICAAAGYGYFIWVKSYSAPAQVYGNPLISTGFGAGLGFFFGLKLRTVFRNRQLKNEDK